MKRITVLALGFALCFGAYAQTNIITKQRGAALPLNTQKTVQHKATSVWYPELIRNASAPIDSLCNVFVDSESRMPIGSLLAGHVGAYATPTFSQEVTVKGAVVYLKLINSMFSESFSTATLQPATGKLIYWLNDSEREPVSTDIDGIAMANACANGIAPYSVNFTTPITCNSLNMVYINPVPNDSTINPNDVNELVAKVPMFGIAIAVADGNSPDFASFILNTEGKILNYQSDIFFFPIIEGGSALTEVEKANMVRVFPNPAKNTVSVVSSFDMSSYEVFNMMGQKVMSAPATGANNLNIDVADLTSGNYIVKVHTNAGVIVKKVVKE